MKEKKAKMKGKKMEKSKKVPEQSMQWGYKRHNFKESLVYYWLSKWQHLLEARVEVEIWFTVKSYLRKFIDLVIFQKCLRTIL